MKKVDYKKDFKALYLPGEQPEILHIPAMPFILVSGHGDPNAPDFSAAMEALYSLSYAVKMSYKSDAVPEGYYEYTVFPLEGVWDLVDFGSGVSDKSNFKYDIMIRQPDFLDNGLFERFLAATKKKKPNPYLDKAKFVTLGEGLACQMMHIGSYDSEPESFRRMEAHCSERGYTRSSLTHREIYLSDPRRVAPDKLRTVLRFTVSR
ncbi:MAG TPA: GyrI-like domain-containing protein [Bacillota bacterium]|nr:GyrI-like domain-containing protein [Bacillota bacterium]